MKTFDTGATRDISEDKLDYEGFLSPAVLQRFAQYMHKHRKQADGKRRDSDNWQKGIPRDSYMKSMTRHFIDLWLIHRGLAHLATDQDIQEVLSALFFNVQGYIHEVLNEPVFVTPVPGTIIWPIDNQSGGGSTAI
jgi:hypothetical protein